MGGQGSLKGIMIPQPESKDLQENVGLYYT